MSRVQFHSWAEGTRQVRSRVIAQNLGGEFCAPSAFPHSSTQNRQMNSNKLRLTPALACAVALFLCNFTLAADKKADRPNVVVILIDDMGFSDLQCYGGDVPTPNINKLAREGVRFTQFYNTARCSPSRAALLTGLYPHEAGMGFLDNMVVPGSKGTQGRLRDDCVTMGEVLGDAGYFTIMTGK